MRETALSEAAEASESNGSVLFVLSASDFFLAQEKEVIRAGSQSNSAVR